MSFHYELGVILCVYTFYFLLNEIILMNSLGDQLNSLYTILPSYNFTYPFNKITNVLGNVLQKYNYYLEYLSTYDPRGIKLLKTLPHYLESDKTIDKTSKDTSPIFRNKKNSKFAGIDPQTIKEVFSKTSSKTPCIYLFKIGSAKELIDKKYTDDDWLCKFGRTDNLKRRTQEHNSQKINSVFNKQISLLHFSVIDSSNLVKAEAELKNLLSPYRIDYKDFDELVVVNKKCIDKVFSIYGMIQERFIGSKNDSHLSDLNEQLNNEKHMREIEYEKHLREIKEKEIEILRLQLEIASKK
jgi:hypothetical protein